jgi:hypothetical protein
MGVVFTTADQVYHNILSSDKINIQYKYFILTVDIIQANVYVAVW